MAPNNRLGPLRSLLRALGLSASAVDEIIERILDFLVEKEAPAPSPITLPYRVRDDFLSPAELRFYLALKLAVADWALVCPKVALGDLFFAAVRDPSQQRSLTNKIDRKHVDFLLCDPTTMRPLAGIELDDKSHERPDRRARDAFVEGVFASAQLPLVRVPVRASYVPGELAHLLRERAGSAAPPPPPPQSASPAHTVPPACPKCGSPMVERRARQGASQGGFFWGCPHYPRCRGTLSGSPPASP